MLSCPPENRLLDLIEGRTTDEGMEILITHLEQCGVCRTIVASFAPRDPIDEATVGQHLGSYLLLRRLGSGGMGVVFEAMHERIGGRAAIKVLYPPNTRDRPTADRFLNEARATNLVQHPGLVHVFEIGQSPTGAAYIVMEYLDGESLGQRLRRIGKFSPGAAVALVRQVADALAATHAKGVIHRDLKPDNIMLVPDPVAPAGERAKILDFGLAKLTQATDALPAFTRSGAIIGTPLYMAPEQCRGGPVDAKADVYSLGVMLYQLLAGRLPFLAKSAGDVMAMHLRDPPPSLDPEVPAALADLLTAMLAKDPAARPAMQKVVERLDAHPHLDPGAAPPDRLKRTGWWRSPTATRGALPVGALLIAVLWSLGVLWQRQGRRPIPRVMAQQGRGVFIPGGTFLMGTPPDGIDAADRWCQGLSSTLCRRDQFEREQPVRQVGVSPFYLDPTEVTNERFAAWLGTRPGVAVEEGRVVREGTTLLLVLDPSHSHGGIAYAGGRFTVPPGEERRPVAWVTWDAALAYCRDQGKRLPTEAEWEYAARGAQGYRFPWGDDEPGCDGVVFARHQGRRCAHLGGAPADVGSSSQDRSPQGVFDLAGNVAEWVMDAYMERYPACPLPCTDPVASAGPSGQRVVRGGDWLLLGPFCRAAFRSRAPAGTTAANIGFRCAVAASRGTL